MVVCVCGGGERLEGGGGASRREIPLKTFRGCSHSMLGGKKKKGERAATPTPTTTPQPPFLCFVITVKRKSLLVDCFHCGGGGKADRFPE